MDEDGGVRLRNERVRESFAAINTDPVVFVKDFYEILFRRSPHLRALFPADLTAQATKLHGTLLYALGELDYLDRTSTILMAMGAKHADKGVEDAHYPLVADALVEALSHASGVWSAEHAAAWHEVLDAMARSMIAGAEMQHITKVG
ncbi:MAG: globin domain-containing protein [Pseudomonadota bacterium]